MPRDARIHICSCYTKVPVAQLHSCELATNPNPNQCVCAFERVLQVPCTLTFKDTLSGAAPSRRLHLVWLIVGNTETGARTRPGPEAAPDWGLRTRTRTTPTHGPGFRVSASRDSCSAASTVKGAQRALCAPAAPGRRGQSGNLCALVRRLCWLRFNKS